MGFAIPRVVDLGSIRKEIEQAARKEQASALNRWAISSHWRGCGCAVGIYWAEVRDADEHPIIHSTVPTTELPGPKCQLCQS